MDNDQDFMDLRGLQPCGPLVAILRRIEDLAARPTPDDEFSVRLLRDPALLYPELVERGWTWERLDSPPDEVRLRLRRGGGDTP